MKAVEHARPRGSGWSGREHVHSSHAEADAVRIFVAFPLRAPGRIGERVIVEGSGGGLASSFHCSEAAAKQARVIPAAL